MSFKKILFAYITVLAVLHQLQFMGLQVECSMFMTEDLYESSRAPGQSELLDRVLNKYVTSLEVVLASGKEPSLNETHLLMLNSLISELTKSHQERKPVVFWYSRQGR